MKYRKQHPPPSLCSDGDDLLRDFLLGAFGAGSLEEIFPGIYDERCDDDDEYLIEENIVYSPEVEEAIARCAAVARARLELPKPDSLIKYWGQGFLGQNIERFVREHWDKHGSLPVGVHVVGANKIDFGSGE
jgi:hypothetical protein